MVRLLLVCGAIVIATGQAAWMQAPAAAPPPSAGAASGAATLRDPEAGGLLIRHYPPTDYNGGGQNWALLQDARGVIYVGSTSALLEFDGVTWRRIQTPTKTTIRSLAADASGRIYVGAVGDLGYIEPDEHGETRFVSLLDKLPEDVRVFEDVWRTFAAPEGIYLPDPDRHLPVGRRDDEGLEADRSHLQPRPDRQRHALHRPNRRRADGTRGTTSWCRCPARSGWVTRPIRSSFRTTTRTC